MSPSASGGELQGLLWEVFLQARAGEPHEHVGSLHAPDAGLALLHARDVYARRGPVASVWVVESERIVASAPADAPSFFDPVDDKVYRHPQFYRTPRAVRL